MRRFLLTLTLLLLALPLGFAEQATGTDPALAAIDAQIKAAGIDKSQSGWRLSLTEPTAVKFPKQTKYFAVMKTNKGTMKIELTAADTPMHVTSFIYLARMGFYDGLVFHRVIQGFMAQGGCPLGTGRGGPGYRFAGETKMNLRHDRRGVLSTANTGQPRTDGSQFFITFKPTPWLDGKHTVFGYVVEGLEVLDALERTGSRTGQTSEKLVLESVKILTAQ